MGAYGAYRRLGRLIYWVLLPYRVTWLTTTNRVGVVLTNQVGEIFLIKNWLGDDAWRLPGGGIKRGESSEVAASRELAEEIGVTCQPTSLSYLGSLRRGAWSGNWSAFRGQLASQTIKINRSEIVAGEWFTPLSLAELRLTDKTKSALSWAGFWPVYSQQQLGSA